MGKHEGNPNGEKRRIRQHRFRLDLGCSIRAATVAADAGCSMDDLRSKVGSSFVGRRTAVNAPSMCRLGGP